MKIITKLLLVPVAGFVAGVASLIYAYVPSAVYALLHRDQDPARAARNSIRRARRGR